MSVPCTVCTDDPILNISAEDADSDPFLFNFDLIQRPPLTFQFSEIGCKRWCYSEISQTDADLCAIMQVIECINDTWQQPDGPNGIVPPLFFNTLQSCSTTCPDGSTFGWLFPAGLVLDLNQVQANRIAYSFACQLARLRRICITTSSPLDPACIGEGYVKTLKARGGTPFHVTFDNLFELQSLCNDTDLALGSTFPYVWTVIAGSLPPGMTLDRCSGQFGGTPTMLGSYTFTVRAMDALGSFQTKSFTIVVAGIQNDSPLPDAFPGADYLVQFIADGSSDIEQEQWSVIAGSLPPGLELSTGGVLSGTVGNAMAGYIFTVQCIFFAGTSNTKVTCTKEYMIETADDHGTVTPDIFSPAVSYWDSTMSIPAGKMRINYVNGAMGYGANPLRAVNLLTKGFHVVYNNGAVDVLFPATNITFGNQAMCEAANAGKFIEFMHTGGTIGMYLDDAPYFDNQNGTPNPTFQLFSGN